MTIGIYRLTFTNGDFYIGRSSNIEVRYSSHIYDMRNNKHSKKVQSSYNISNSVPTLDILEVCNINDIADREKYWITKLDAVTTGLNTTVGGEDILVGEDNSSAKYTNEQIENLFHDLVKYPETSLVDLSNIHNISINVVKSVSNRSRHLWLKDKYPDEFNILIFNSKKRAETSLGNLSKDHGFKRDTPYPKIVSPGGVVHTVEVLGQFAALHNLQPGNLSMVLNGKRKSHKGWKLAQGDIS